MPMLHSCGFPGCDTRTLSTYCLEHEVIVRAKMLAEQMESADAHDEPLSAEFAEVARPGLSAA
jgi:hypothetical protein